MPRDSLDHQSSFRLALDVKRVSLRQELDILLEQLEIHTLLRRVDQHGADLDRCQRRAECISGERMTHSQGTERSDVTALSTLRLNNKDSVPAGGCRLLDCVTGIDQRVQRRIATEREVRKRDVVGDRAGQVDHGDLEGGVRSPVLLEDHDRVERLESTDDEQGIDVVSLEGAGHLSEIRAWQCPVRTEVSTTSGRPCVDSQPGQFGHIIVDQALETVVDRDGRVSAVVAESDSLSSSGVHSTGRGADADVLARRKCIEAG